MVEKVDNTGLFLGEISIAMSLFSFYISNYFIKTKKGAKKMIGNVTKIIGIAGAVLSGVSMVADKIWPHGDELEERVSELEKIIKEGSKK